MTNHRFLSSLRFFRPLKGNGGPRPEKFAQGLAESRCQSRRWEEMYHRRWEHDKVVRSTHGVNCTGGCSWQVYVKDGIVVWETQCTDYPHSGSSLGDLITLLLLLIVIGLGTYNVTFVPHENVLYDVAPWLRGILTFAPDTRLLVTVPFSYKLHFLAVFTLFAFYPFSRLVHITSAPVTYVYRVYLLFRRRCEGF